MSDFCQIEPHTMPEKGGWIGAPVPRRDCSYKDVSDDWYFEDESHEKLVVFDLFAQLPVATISDPQREIFNELASQWKSETWFLSSVKKRMSHIAYLQIIGMGAAALPYIFEAMRAEPDHWFGALEAITRENPAPHAENMTLLRDAWLRWAELNGY